MTIDRELWLTTWFVDRDTPPWPCPLCKHGTLLIERRRGGRIRRRELRARRRKAKRRRMFRRIFGLRPKKYPVADSRSDVLGIVKVSHSVVDRTGRQRLLCHSQMR